MHAARDCHPQTPPATQWTEELIDHVVRVTNDVLHPSHFVASSPARDCFTKRRSAGRGIAALVYSKHIGELRVAVALCIHLDAPGATASLIVPQRRDGLGIVWQTAMRDACPIVQCERFATNQAVNLGLIAAGCITDILPSSVTVAQ